MSAIAYRPDIDGLRAVAVGTVVLFHAGLGLFPGGFIGVDVFFVISGYLITSIIVRELDAGTFSLLSFYERRIRRIFPALLVVIAACLAVGAWRMSPDDYARLGESALAAIGFHSNFYFAGDAGYFMPEAETMPLLHTWSLGVEEQFYVVAPLLLMVMWRAKRWLAPAFWLFAAGALGLSLWGLARNSDTAFYLPHTRAIELMIGMALGLGLVPEVRSRLGRQVLSSIGLALIFGAASLYDKTTPFPGLAALVPCVGSALIIHCAGGVHGTGVVGRVLSTSPAVWLGKISYSLYLWHWPIFAFAAYEWGEIDALSRVALVALSVVLSAATYLWIEQPARTSRQILTPARVYAAGLGSAGVLAAAASAVASTDGWPTRLNPDVVAFEAKAANRGDISDQCYAHFRGKTAKPCQLGDPNGPTHVLAWGDSHAMALAPQFDAVGKRLGVSVLLVANGGCPPLLQSGSTIEIGRAKCRDKTDRVLKILDQGTIRHVVIVSRWGTYIGRPLGETSGRRSNPPPPNAAEIRETFTSSFSRTLARFHDAGLRVTVIGPVPELPVHLPSSMMKALMRGQEFSLTYDFSKFSTRQTLILGLLAGAEKKARVDVIYPDRIFCPLGKCQFIDNGLPLYRDDDHLNLYGGDRLKPSLAQSLAWLDRRGTIADRVGP